MEVPFPQVSKKSCKHSEWLSHTPEPFITSKKVKVVQLSFYIRVALFLVH